MEGSGETVGDPTRSPPPPPALPADALSSSGELPAPPAAVLAPPAAVLAPPTLASSASSSPSGAAGSHLRWVDPADEEPTSPGGARGVTHPPPVPLCLASRRMRLLVRPPSGEPGPLARSGRRSSDRRARLARPGPKVLPCGGVAVAAAVPGAWLVVPSWVRLARRGAPRRAHRARLLVRRLLPPRRSRPPSRGARHSAPSSPRLDHLNSSSGSPSLLCGVVLLPAALLLRWWQRRPPIVQGKLFVLACLPAPWVV